MTSKDKPKRAAGKPFPGDKKTKAPGEAAEKKANAARSAKPKPAVDAAPESGPDKPERISKILARAGVASRRDENRRLGLSLRERAGAIITATETVAFDLLGQAGTDAFKAVSKLVR